MHDYSVAGLGGAVLLHPFH